MNIERRNEDGSLSIGVLEDMNIQTEKAETPVEEAPKKAKKTTKKK